MNTSQSTAGIADKIAIAQIIARGLERQNDELVDALISRFGVDAAWLATDPDFLSHLGDYVQRNKVTRVWWPVGGDEDDWGSDFDD